MKKVFFALGLIVFSFPAMAEMAERSTFKVIDNNTFKYSSRIDHIFSHDDNNVEIDRYLMLENFLHKNGLLPKGLFH